MGTALSSAVLRLLKERDGGNTDQSMSYGQPLAEPALSAAPARTVTPRDLFDSSMQAGNARPAGDLTPRAAFNSSMIMPLKEENRRRIEAATIQPLGEPPPAVSADAGYAPLTEPEMRQQLGPAASSYLPGPAQQRARDLLSEPAEKHSGEHMGIGGHILHGLKTAGKVLVTTGNPFLAVAGGVAGTADPDSLHRFERNAIELPRALSEAGSEMALQSGSRDAAKDYGAISGRNLYSGGLTPDAAHKQAQQLDLLDEANNRHAQRATEERRLSNDEAKTRLSRLDSFVKSARPGAVVPPELAQAAGLPAMAGQPVYRHEASGTHYIKGSDGTTYQLKDGVGSEVLDSRTGQPIRQHVPPPPREQTPQYVYEGRAQAELEREMGITQRNALVDNPAFADALETERQADVSNANEYGYAPASMEVLRARVAKKVPPKIKAGELITGDMVKQRAAQIYERERGGRIADPSHGGARPQSGPSNRMAEHEAGYQKLYKVLSPEDRKQMEDSFKAEYGRLPRKPAGVN